MQHTKIKKIIKLQDKFSKYDLEIDKNHNFFANDILVHNCRCITIINEKGDIKFYSRGGNEFLTLEVLAEDIKKLGLKSKVLDGEVCIMKKDGLEDFQGIIKEIGRKNHTIESPFYHIFDFLELDEFQNKSGNVSLSARLILLNAIVHGLTYAAPLLQIQIGSKEEFDKIVFDASEMGYEGIMLRKDVGYEGKRSKNLLKVKKMTDAEYVVIGINNSINRIIENGVEIEEEMLSNIIIEHKGNTVDVGSGFSLAQRRLFYKKPELILGKTVCIQYFEETTDQKGNHSLRFPVIKSIYEGKREF